MLISIRLSLSTAIGKGFECMKTLLTLGASTQGPRTSSAQIGFSRESLSRFESPDSRLRVSVSRRTPGLSERMSDIDAYSIQLDAYDDVVEGIYMVCSYWVVWILLTNHTSLHCLTLSVDLISDRVVKMCYLDCKDGVCWQR